MEHRIILGIGSNYDQENKVAYADEQLCALFSSIRFSQSYYSRQEGNAYSVGPYMNQVAIAYTTLLHSEIIPLLKAIEKAAGRSKELKVVGVVPLDIDLIQWNDMVLKPEDLTRSYVRKGLDELLLAEE